MTATIAPTAPPAQQAAFAHLDPQDQALLAGELDLHERVKQAVRTEALAAMPDMNVIKERLVELRDQAITASEHDLPALFQQLYTHHSLAERSFDKKLPDMRAPYFAHVQLVEKGKARDVLIGYQTFIDSKTGITIIDWRHAALAKVFFNYREGDEYELELPGRLATGVLTMRRVITFEVGELTGVSGPEYTFVRERGGNWRRIAGRSVPELKGGAGTAVNVQQFGLGLSNRRLPDVSALLDPEQYEILNREDEGALLILGGAGSGKTTVALHRMALLAYKKPRFYQQRAMQVVVPEQGLVRLSERLLQGLGLGDVKVATLDTWVADQGRQILKGLPRRLYDWTPPAVVTIKRHPAMLAVLDRYAEVQAERVVTGLRFVCKGWHDELVTEFESAPQIPIMQRLERIEQKCKQLYGEGAPSNTQFRRETLERFFKETRAKLLDNDTARSELYTHPELLVTLKAASDGQITDKMLQELHRHTRRQFEDSGGGSDDVRGTRTVDGAELEADDYAGTMDVEDFAVLLGWMLKLHGRVSRKTKNLLEYKHLVVDEAQDLAPLEFKLLGQSLGDQATVTVAGDAAQQSDPTVAFRGWDDVLTQLGLPETSEARLATNYRCPRPVAEFGHRVLGALAPAALPSSIKDGEPVIFSLLPNEGLAIVAITDALSQLSAQEPLASVAIVCAGEESARHFYAGLSGTLDVRLVVDGEFSFKPGIDITDVSQVKGLEFDYVILPDVNVSVYPDTPVARRSLHIAVTRAVHQLWVISVGKRSDILG